MKDLLGRVGSNVPNLFLIVHFLVVVTLWLSHWVLRVVRQVVRSWRQLHY